MARKTKVVLTCDRHRGEVEAVSTVDVGIDGDRRSVDLCADHLAEFRTAVRPWYSRTAKAARGQRRGAAAADGNGARRRPRSKSATDVAEVRSWARQNGFEVNDRGRLPAAIREAFVAAQR
jgi:hypothetical protein